MVLKYAVSSYIKLILHSPTFDGNLTVSKIMLLF